MSRGVARRSCISAVTVGTVLAASGCVSYTARLSRSVERGDVRVRLDSAVVQRHGLAKVESASSRVVFVVESVPANVKLLGASVGTNSDDPCGGATATAWGRSAGKDAHAALATGETLTVAFERTDALLVLTSDSPKLDLSLETSEHARRCIRVPLTASGPIDWNAHERVTLGVAFSIEGFVSTLGPVDRMVTIPISLGIWVAGTHLDVGGGFAGVGCPEPTCTPTERDSRIDYSTAFPVQAGVERDLVELGDVTLGLGLKYRAMRLTADTVDGHRAFWMHGPVLSPYVGFTSPHTGKIGGSRESLVGVEIPIGYAITAEEGRSVSAGVNLSMQLTAF